MDATSWTLVRWGAPAALIGGVLFVASTVLTNFFVVAGALRYAADVPAYTALALGLMGLYTAQSQRLGLVGEAGFCIALSGFTMAALGGLGLAFIVWTSGPQAVPGWLAAAVRLGILFVIFGSLLFGIGTLRAKILPRGGTLLLIAGPLLFAVMLFGEVQDARLFTLSSVLFGVGWAWLGYELPVAARKKRLRRIDPLA